MLLKPTQKNGEISDKILCVYTSFSVRFTENYAPKPPILQGFRAFFCTEICENSYP